jgi:hypothetical protein
VSEDPTVCCLECEAIDALWPRMQLARSILQHRPPNAATVALALRALDGASIDLLRGDSPAVAEPGEVD